MARLLDRPENMIFTRVAGAPWDNYTIGFYEDMHDFAIAFGQFSAKYMLSKKCHQTWYYTYLDIPKRGQVYDPWVFDHTDTTGGERALSVLYVRPLADGDWRWLLLRRVQYGDMRIRLRRWLPGAVVLGLKSQATPSRRYATIRA